MPDGKHKRVHFVARSTHQAGQIEYVGALMDVTETRRTQEALHRSMTELAHVTRVTMLGELAASIAHEGQPADCRYRDERPMLRCAGLIAKCPTMEKRSRRSMA